MRGRWNSERHKTCLLCSKLQAQYQLLHINMHTCMGDGGWLGRYGRAPVAPRALSNAAFSLSCVARARRCKGSTPSAWYHMQSAGEEWGGRQRLSEKGAEGERGSVETERSRKAGLEAVREVTNHENPACILGTARSHAGQHSADGVVGCICDGAAGCDVVVKWAAHEESGHIGGGGSGRECT